MGKQMKKCSKCSKMSMKMKHTKKMKSKETPKFKAKVSKVMKEFKGKKLHSGSKKGPLVKNPKQAIAISLSEARKATKE